MSAKAAPKTLHQVRNLAYIFAAWAGLQKGYAEKSANDKLWKEHQRLARQKNVERQEAARALQSTRLGAEAGDNVPSILPQELQSVYKVFEK